MAITPAQRSDSAQQEIVSSNQSTASIDRLLNIKEIYYEPAALEYIRGQEILAQHPDTKLIEVASHWNIPELHGNEGAVEDWNRIKRTVLVLGVKKSLQGKTRIRFSLMPQSKAAVVDVRTSSITDRIQAVNDFVEAGYEVHLNFSPVIYYDGWLPDYEQLLEQIDDTLSPQAKEQLQSEVIFLTHNDRLHEVNMGWHPQAEALLWRPDLQETKFSQTGGKNVRYKRGFKGTLVEALTSLINERLPYCNIRYAF